MKGTPKPQEIRIIIDDTPDPSRMPHTCTVTALVRWQGVDGAYTRREVWSDELREDTVAAGMAAEKLMRTAIIQSLEALKASQ